MFSTNEGVHGLKQTSKGSPWLFVFLWEHCVDILFTVLFFLTVISIHWAILWRMRALQKYPRKLYSERLLGTQNFYESTNENGWLSVEWLQVISHKKKWLEMVPFLIHVKMVGFLVPGINWVGDFIHPISPHVSIYHQKFQVPKKCRYWNLISVLLGRLFSLTISQNPWQIVEVWVPSS